ncbi:MAG: hypothetical protein JWP00_4383 [Chloroflexi bacterium]|jgi:putative ABC transport system permease protein|nr:hypothetical protein [Chloroflexota bacterium]
MKKFTLYTKYAWRSIQRGGQRSFFAILCVAVGVAAIVALQTTGFSIQDAVAGDARTNARADVVVNSRQRFFTDQDLAQIEAIKQKGTILDYTTWNEDNGLTIKKADGSSSNQFGSFFLAFSVDPAKYPFYGQPALAQPKDKTLKDLLVQPGQIVLNDKMATSLGAKVGDKIKAEGDKMVTLEVVGILSGNTATPDNGQASFTGYSYISQATAKLAFKPENIQPGTVFIKTTSTLAADNAARDAVKAASPIFDAKTSGELNDQLKQASSGLRQMLSYVGLISLLIGSVGVVNTMLVVVGRRSTEIATIKALGMESNQTVRVFMIESAILGVFGSVIGVILGVLLSLVLSAAASSFVARQLEFNLYFQPIWMGLVVGIVTAVVFGLLPAYSASKIPPAQVLRQKTNALPRISFIATALIIIVMALVMGLLAGIILDGQFIQGIVLAFGTLVACSILVLVFSGILWVVGKLPLPFGLNYKMARRNLSRGRAKSATTMLVMMVGIFSVALVIILASSLKDTLKNTIESSFGYNLAYSSTDKDETDKMAKLLSDKQVPGQLNYVTFARSNVRMISGGGVSAQELIARKLQKDAQNPDQNQNRNDGFGNGDLAFLGGLSSQDVGGMVKLVEGANFTNDDQVVISKDVRDNYGLKVGDKLVYQDLSNGQPFTLTVSGIVEQKNFLVSLGPAATTYTRVQTLPGNMTQFTINVDRAQLEQAKTFIQSSMGKEATDLSFITNIFNQIIDQITAFPVLLAMLSLIAGGVLIANNVALAVLERRTEMGVMKSLGADSSRVFQIISWETNIVAFLGAVLGFALASGIASALVGVFGTADNPAVLSISPVVTIGLLGLAVGLSLLATFGSAWGASREKPLVVLRYE